MYEELWLREAYRFNSRHAEPVILDCGANIGLSVISQKPRYPGAHHLFRAGPGGLCGPGGD